MVSFLSGEAGKLTMQMGTDLIINCPSHRSHSQLYHQLSPPLSLQTALYQHDGSIKVSSQGTYYVLKFPMNM